MRCRAIFPEFRAQSESHDPFATCAETGNAEFVRNPIARLVFGIRINRRQRPATSGSRFGSGDRRRQRTDHGRRCSGETDPCEAAFANTHRTILRDDRAVKAAIEADASPLHAFARTNKILRLPPRHAGKIVNGAVALRAMPSPLVARHLVPRFMTRRCDFQILEFHHRAGFPLGVHTMYFIDRMTEGWKGKDAVAKCRWHPEQLPRWQGSTSGRSGEWIENDVAQ